MPSHWNDDRGFTAMEILVALVIVGILTAILGMGPGFLPGLQLNSGARQVLTDLRLARAKAVAQNAVFRVTFSTGAEWYTVERRVPGSSPAVWEDYALYGRDAGAIKPGSPQPIPLPLGVEIVTNEVVTFRPRGSVTFCAGCTGQVQLRRNGVATPKVVTTFLNGLVQIG